LSVGADNLFFVVLRQFSQVVGEWLENQILIPDWAYFYYPGATLIFSQDIGEWPENQILIPDWTHFHCPGASLQIYANQFSPSAGTTLVGRLSLQGGEEDAPPPPSSWWSWPDVAPPDPSL